MPLRPDEILTTLETHLRAYVEAKKGALSIAEDPFHVYEILADGPGGFHVIIAWGGDKEVSGHATVGIVENRIKVIISYNRGLAIKQGAHLTIARGTQGPLYKLLSEVRAKCRELTYAADDTDVNLEYQGADEFAVPGDLPLDAYEMNFTLHSNLPQTT